jgi:LysR family transcriptional regulator, glycine cleavage system transcriptional activator
MLFVKKYGYLMKRQLPPLKQLRSFEAAARHQSFTTAAGELNVTPAAVSRLVKSLEDYLGISLFDRGSSHIALTRYGKQYLSRITPALDEIAVATAELTGEWQKKLTIAAFPSIAQRWLIPKWAEFSRHHPDMKIEIRTSHTVPGYDSDGIDASVRVIPPNDTTLIWEKIFDDALIAVCSPQMSIDRERMDFTKIHCRTRINDWTLWAEQSRLLPTDTRYLDGMEFDNLPAAIEAAIQGIGVTIAIKSVVQPELESGTLVAAFPDVPSLPCPFYLTYPQDRARHPTLRAFHQFVSQ